MGHDHVWGKPVLLQLLGGPVGRFAPVHLGFKIMEPAVCLAAGRRQQAIGHRLHTRQGRARVDVHGHHAVARQRCERGRQMLELTRKVLVNEKDIHAY